MGFIGEDEELEEVELVPEEDVPAPAVVPEADPVLVPA